MIKLHNWSRNYDHDPVLVLSSSITTVSFHPCRLPNSDPECVTELPVSGDDVPGGGGVAVASRDP